MRASAFAAAVLAASSLAGAQPAEVLRFRWRAGQRVRYTVETEQSVSPGPRASRSSVTEEIETVSVSAEGVASQRLRVLDLTLDAAVPRAQRDALMRGLRGVSVEYRQDPRGAISASRVVGEADAQVAAFVRTIVESLEQTGAPLPEGPARVGQTWVDRRAMTLRPAPGVTTTLNVDNTYTLRAVRGRGAARVVVLEQSSAMSAPRDAQVAGMPLTVSGGARATTEMRLEGGAMERSEGRGTLRLSVSGRGRAVNLEIGTRTRLRAVPARATVDES